MKLLTKKRSRFMS